MNQIASPLAHFRAEWYQTIGLRCDTLTNLVDAVLTVPRVSSLVALSQAPVFARTWSAISDALTHGSLDLPALRQVLLRYLPAPPPDQRPLWAIDGSTWPRPAARTSPERTLCRVTIAGPASQTILPGWEYQWLMAIPEASGSWVLPLDLRRRAPAAGTPTDLAISQLQAVLEAGAGVIARPVVVLDSHYRVAAIARAVPAVDVLARLATNRRFYRPPRPYDGKGRRPIHGPVFRCGEPATQHEPAATQTWPDDRYGTVTATVWHDLHTQPDPTVPLAVIRITVAHLPRRDTPPAPLWLCWHGTTMPDLRTLVGWYQRRFIIEHGFRFLKQDLGWTTPRLQDPASADRWSWLLALVLWHLWLARAQVAIVGHAWDPTPRPGPARSPGQVRRGMGGVLAGCGSPARSPKPRGMSPGRRPDQGRGPRTRYPPHVRTPQRAA